MLVWHLEVGYWRSAEDITPQELLRRYAFLATFGNLSPSASEVLGDTRRIIGIRLDPADAVMAPGGSTTIDVAALRMDGQEPIVFISLRSRPRATPAGLVGLGGGNGTLSTLMTALREVVTWTTPDTQNYVYEITAALGPMEVGTVVGTPFCLVATGVETEMVATAEPATIEPGGDGVINFRITDGDGQPIDVKGRVLVAGLGIEVEGRIYMSGTTPGAGYAVYHAPEEPGRYLVAASFSGYIDAGFLTGMNAMAAEADVYVTVEGEAEQTPVVTQPVAEEDRPERPEEITFPPRYLVHIIETRTPGGPEEKDVWILFGGEPDENGILLTPDDYGGVFVNRADRGLGPFTSSYELCPVMVQLGIPVIWYGRNFIKADPAVWGGEQ